jgi:hypothetical protein
MEKIPLAGGGVGEGEGGTGGPSARIVEAGGMRVAIEGCCHGTLDEIYSKRPPPELEILPQVAEMNPLVLNLARRHCMRQKQSGQDPSVAALLSISKIRSGDSSR